MPITDILPAPIVTEIAYLLQIELGPTVKAAFLDALARGALTVKDGTTRSQAHGIGPNYAEIAEVRPLSTRRRFVPVEELQRRWHDAPAFDPVALRAESD
jgi:hypothetical protein